MCILERFCQLEICLNTHDFAIGKSRGRRREGEPFTGEGLVKEEKQKLSNFIENLLSIMFTVSVKRQPYQPNLKK